MEKEVKTASDLDEQKSKTHEICEVYLTKRELFYLKECFMRLYIVNGLSYDKSKELKIDQLHTHFARIKTERNYIANIIEIFENKLTEPREYPQLILSLNEEDKEFLIEHVDFLISAEITHPLVGCLYRFREAVYQSLEEFILYNSDTTIKIPNQSITGKIYHTTIEEYFAVDGHNNNWHEMHFNFNLQNSACLVVETKNKNYVFSSEWCIR